MDLTGQIIADRYKVIQSLGEGAMGAVYLAEDTVLARHVALKVLRAELADRIEVHKRLENECRIQARIGAHPNMVTLFDRITHGDSVVLVMEYVRGENLHSILERTRRMTAGSESARATRTVGAGAGPAGVGGAAVLGQAEAVEIVLQCLAALEFAHNRGILHRDVKPSNILITRDDNGRPVAKLMDFGIAKALGGAGEMGGTSLTQAGAPGPGTPMYMAPEQIDPQRFGPPGPASDFYALGVTMYEMLTLSPPFRGTYTELLNYHTNVEPPDPRSLRPDLAPGLEQVVRKALRKRPEERYRSAAEFRADLQAPGAGTVVPGPGPVPPVPAKKKQFDKRILLFAAVLLVVSGIYFVQQRENPAPRNDPNPVIPAALTPAPGSVNPAVIPISAESERQEIEKSRNDADAAKSRALAAQAKSGNSAGQKLYNEAKDLYDLGVSQQKQKQINDALTSFKKARQQFDAAEAEWRNSIQSIAPKSPDLATIILTPAPTRTPTASPTVRPRPKVLTGAEINSARALAENARARALNSKPLSVDVKQDKNFQAGETNMNSGNWDMFSPEERVKYYNNAASFFSRAEADWRQRLQDPPPFPRNTPRSTRSRVRAPGK